MRAGIKNLTEGSLIIEEFREMKQQNEKLYNLTKKLQSRIWELEGFDEYKYKQMYPDNKGAV